jgi:hypothetical protein
MNKAEIGRRDCAEAVVAFPLALPASSLGWGEQARKIFFQRLLENL